jgi:hypothetical protein
LSSSLPWNVHVPVQHDLAFGERAGLIAAENLDAAEVLDGRQLLDQDLLLGHPARALRQRDGDDHGHHLRRHPHGKRDREQERFQQRAMQDDVHQQDEQHQQHDHARDHHPEVAYAAAEFGLRRPHGQPLGNLAEGGVLAGANDDRGADSRLHGGPQENAVAGVGDAVLPRWKISRRFVDGQGLSGERGLAHVQVLGIQQRASAGTRSPALSRTISPGTSSATGSSSSRPSRKTRRLWRPASGYPRPHVGPGTPRRSSRSR